MRFVLVKGAKISEVAKECPRAIEMLTDYGLACANCFLNQFDTVEAGAALHGMSEGEIAQMVEEINMELAKEGGDE